MAQVQTRKGRGLCASACVCVCVWGGAISGLTCALSQLTGLYDFSRVHVNGTVCVLFNLISECVECLLCSCCVAADGMFGGMLMESWTPKPVQRCIFGVLISP